MPRPGRSAPPITGFEHLLADMFRRARWRVQVQPSAGGMRPDLLAESGGKQYAIELKRSPEGRRDRLIPLLSQAILQIRAAARALPKAAVPVAVVAAEHIPESTAEQVKQFAKRYAPETGVGIVDARGLRSFAGHGLELFDARPVRPSSRTIATPQRLPHLFSDLNQWMLKILLGQQIPDTLLTVPRARFRNATQLAAAAHVSVMSASRFLRQLRKEGFLDDLHDRLAIVRIEELLARWAEANRQSVQEIPVRWIVRKDSEQLINSVRTYTSRAGAAARKRPPRCAIALFAAADALGFGFVRGVPTHIYLERPDPDVIRELGLSPENAAASADAYIRIPANSEAVFRAAVTRNGLPVSDILQIWLDVSGHPVRGRDQAEQIRKRALASLFSKR